MDHASSAQTRSTTTGIRLLLIAASVLVFWAGVPLFLGSTQTADYFAWTIQPPFTAAFLGAMYWSSLVLLVSALRRTAWADARIPVFSILVVTTLILIATLLHLDRFHLASPALLARLVTWAWLAVYLGIPPITVLLLVDQLRRPGQDGARTGRLPPWIKLVCRLQVILLIVVGGALVVIPLTVAAFWPWQLTALTAQVAGAWIIGLGLNAGLVAWEDDLARVQSVLLSSIVFVGLQAIALARFPTALDWSSPGSWLFVLALLSFLVVGVAGWLSARRLGPDIRQRSAG